MAIERVKRAWFLVERGELDPFIDGLAASKAVHVVDLKEAMPGDSVAMTVSPRRPGPDLANAEAKAHKLARTLDLLDSLAPPKRTFAANFVNLPTEMSQAEYDQAVVDVQVDELHEEVESIHREVTQATKRSEELTARIKELEPWASAELPPAGLARCFADLGVVPDKTLAALRAAAEASETLAVSVEQEIKGKALVAAVWMKEADADARNLLSEHGFESLKLPAGPGRVERVVQSRHTALVTVEAKIAVSEQRAGKLAERRRAIGASHAYWQAEVERLTVASRTLASKRIAVLTGYVRVREMASLTALLNENFPSVSLEAVDPGPDEDVPVSLGGSKMFAPAQFLTSMFGLPGYFDFDPSPYIFCTFLLFFGMCFGDVVYGVGLIALCLWFAAKSSAAPSLARLFRLLAWGGVFSILVGVITGSWASDLFAPVLENGMVVGTKYWGSGVAARGFAGMIHSLSLFDPADKPVIALVVALGLGMLNQFYALVLLMYRNLRKGDLAGAVFDGGLWLIFLPGLVLLLLGSQLGWPSAVRTLSLVMITVGGVGLVLTQGRKETTFLGKAITGVVSLYGILGSYGTTSFIGDTLSYSRLLALGLTTVIVGQSANMIAGLTLSWGAIGLLVFLVIVVFGHTGNFLISILGAFVHSARLIFVEFFTKFYDGGARPFAPLGAPKQVRITED